MIRTGLKRIPWWWLGVMSVPVMGGQFVEHCSGAALTFTMSKFIKQPWLLTLLASTNILFNFVVAPIIAYQSDRIWTRFGRRKPFIVAGWVGLVVSLVFVPLAPNLWTLVIVIILYQFFEDIAFTGPWTPLYNEVVPVPQRGRASGFNVFLQHVTTLYFSFFLIGKFDEKKVSNVGSAISGFFGFGQVSISGEQKIYWIAAAVIIGATIVVAFLIKETPVAQHKLLGERFSISVFLKSVFGERQWMILYILIFAQVAMNQGIATFGPLMMTKQFGYSKATMGQIDGWIVIARMILVIPFAGYFADRFDRVRIFQFSLVVATVHHISWWTWIQFVALEGVPTITAIVAFNIFGTFVNVAGNIALAPLLFDFIPRDRMGTVFAGMSFVRGIIKIILLNGVGVWVTFYSKFFPPSRGEFDYSCALLYTTLLGFLGCLTSVYFVAQRRKGKMIEYGRLEAEAEAKQPVIEEAPLVTAR